MPPRTNGLTAAAGALRYWERKQEITAHNLANATTDGFKAERAFAELLGEATPVARARTDMAGGTLRQTGNALDVALEGDAFLVVGTPQGERFSRGGALRLDDARRLVDHEGHPVLGDHGEIVLPPGARVDLAADGTLGVDGRAVARLRLERAGSTTLAREGTGLFVPDAGRAPAAPGTVRVRQGSLEESNVNPIGALVEMIVAQRAYASVQKAVTTMDAVRGTATTELGRPI